MSPARTSGRDLLKRVEIACGPDCLPTSFADLAIRSTGQPEGGFLYVVEFGAGLMKVGRAWNPQTRLSSHAMTAEVWGSRITRAWVSQRMWNHGPVEREILDWCTKRYTAVGATEYFRQGDFDAAVEYANEVCKSHAPPTVPCVGPGEALRMLSVAEVSKRTGLSEYAVRQAIRTGELGSKRRGRSLYIPAGALETYAKGIYTASTAAYVHDVSAGIETEV